MYNYADDNCIAYAHKDIETIKSVLERDIKKMLDWFKNNSLQANPYKFQSMLLKNKTVNAEDFNIIVDNDILNLADDMTVLGINISIVMFLVCAIRPVDSWMFCSDLRVP